MPTLTAPAFDLARTKPRALFLTDNGRCLCGQHLGSSARFSGRDLSGQPILELTAEVLDIAREEFAGYTPSCESCGLTAEGERLRRVSLRR